MFKPITGVYVISTQQRADNDEYKIGKFTSTKDNLLSRYATYLTKPIIYYLVEHSNNSFIEKEVLKKLSQYRLLNHRNRPSEWVKCSLSNIINTITCVVKSTTPITTKNTTTGSMWPDPSRMDPHAARYYGLSFFTDHPENMHLLYKKSSSPNLTPESSSDEYSFDDSDEDNVSKHSTVQSTIIQLENLVDV